MKWARRVGLILALAAAIVVVVRLLRGRRGSRPEDAIERPAEAVPPADEAGAAPVAVSGKVVSVPAPAERVAPNEAAELVVGGDDAQVQTEVEVGIVELVDHGDGAPRPSPAELAEIVASAAAQPGMVLPAELPMAEVLDIPDLAVVDVAETPEAQEPPLDVGPAVEMPPVSMAVEIRADVETADLAAQEASPPAVPAPNARAEALLDEGNAHFNVGQYALAVERYDQAVDLEPGLVAALYNRANARTRLGQYDEALTDYDAAIALNPRDADALNNRGMLHLHQGNFENALADLDRALGIDPLDTTVVVNRGLVRLHMGEYVVALDDFTEAARIDPRDAAAHYGAAQACALLGDEPAALNSLRNAFRLDQTYLREAAADPRLAALQHNAEFARMLRDTGR